MKSMNRVTLLGNVGQDPETKTSANGNKVTKTSLATNEKWKDASGAVQEKTEWHRLTFFGKLADIAGEYIKKGDALLVEGRIEYSQTEGNDGVTRYWCDIIVKELHLLGKRGDSNAGAQASKPAAQPAAAPAGGKPLSEPDDDLPF